MSSNSSERSDAESSSDIGTSGDGEGESSRQSSVNSNEFDVGHTEKANEAGSQASPLKSDSGSYSAPGTPVFDGNSKQQVVSGGSEESRGEKELKQNCTDEGDKSNRFDEKREEKRPTFAVGSDDESFSSNSSAREENPALSDEHSINMDDHERSAVSVSPAGDDDDHAGDAGSKNGRNGKSGLENIQLSESDSDEESNREKSMEPVEDDIVGPRLYPDPENQTDDEEHLEPTIVEVNTARICPNFQDDGLYFLKVPNFLSIDSRPFDPDHFEDEYDEDDVMDEEGRARLKLRVENTIRWRYTLNEEGELIKESNAKIVKWSDGTMGLYLGNELFDVSVQPMQKDNHLFMRQGAGLQGHAVFKDKLVFRPHSTDSITHRKMTLSMADRSNKSGKVKVVNAVGKDPESQKAELVRREEEKFRAQHRREAQQRRNRLRPVRHNPGLSASFLEERDDDSDAADESLGGTKGHYKHHEGDAYPVIGHSDSDDSASRRLQEAKNDNSSTDSDESHSKRSKKKKVIIEDDED
ncbi:hypothetical protein AB6A40_005271 [Gnathostoma spinigerum]|uniref:RNA polymerase-associated protein LEO1 n=1 Tax=Gnathostoma spinigerum TaxID=75299 RepID=A0ABD6EPS8_9BILA